MPTLVICTTEELEAQARYVDRLRFDGVDAYLRDAAALVYASEGAGLMRADEVWATDAAYAEALIHYPQARKIGAAAAAASTEAAPPHKRPRTRAEQ